MCNHCNGMTAKQYETIRAAFITDLDQSQAAVRSAMTEPDAAGVVLEVYDLFADAGDTTELAEGIANLSDEALLLMSEAVKVAMGPYMMVWSARTLRGLRVAEGNRQGDGDG